MMKYSFVPKNLLFENSPTKKQGHRSPGKKGGIVTSVREKLTTRTSNLSVPHYFLESDGALRHYVAASRLAILGTFDCHCYTYCSYFSFLFFLNEGPTKTSSRCNNMLDYLIFLLPLSFSQFTSIS